MRLAHIGGPTVLIQVAGWRLLTDPTFDPPGRKYSFGRGTGSVKLAGPAIAPSDVGPIDAVLLTHDHHDDNLDPAGRALLASADAVVTTVSGAGRLGRGARGLEPWATTTLEAPGRPEIRITATPCRHGPPLSRLLAGDVVGFALCWDGQEHGVLWISGDTVLYDGVRQVADRLAVDVALLHLGGVQFPVTGPVRYTLTGRTLSSSVASSGRVLPFLFITRVGSTSSRAERKSSTSSRLLRKTSAGGSGGCPWALRSKSRNSARRRLRVGAQSSDVVDTRGADLPRLDRRSLVIRTRLGEIGEEVRPVGEMLAIEPLVEEPQELRGSMDALPPSPGAYVVIPGLSRNSPLVASTMEPARLVI
jgi:L-ascorbate metabolism protein UlaG (beta-lactamase superfamily)